MSSVPAGTAPAVGPGATAGPTATGAGAPGPGTNTTAPPGVTNRYDEKGNPRGQIAYRYHPFLFLLLAMTAIAEIGLTASLVRNGRNSFWPTSLYRSAIIFLLFLACWTTLWALFHMFTSFARTRHVTGTVGFSTVSLLIMAILWGIASGLLTRGRPMTCFSSSSICHQATAAEALGWIAFTLIVLTLLSHFYHGGRTGYGSGYSA